MMLLADIGNSRIKLGWLDRASGAREPEPLALAHDPLQTAHGTYGLETWLQGLPHAPLAAVGVNVASAAVADHLQAALGLPVRWIRASACAGSVRNSYTHPARLGADRWLGLIGVAARTRHEPASPLVLVNAGTATTIDTLAPQDADGTRLFLGGLILPGPRLMRTSLAQHTANLPLVNDTTADATANATTDAKAGATADFPVHTDAAIVSGVCAAQAGAVTLQWRRAFARFGRAPALYVSGGDWHLLASAVHHAIAQAHTDLGLAPAPLRFIQSPVLDGLAHLAAFQTL